VVLLFKDSREISGSLGEFPQTVVAQRRVMAYKTRIMLQRCFLFSAMSWLIVCSSWQPLSGWGREVRRALPVDGVPSVAPTAPFGPQDAQEIPQSSGAAAQASVALTPSAVSALAVYPSTAPGTVASSAIMIDARAGSIIFFKNPDIHRPVASTQKLLTALLVAEHGGLDSRVRVLADDCAVEPTKLGIKPGEVYMKRELLAAMLVHSCNDAALCLARNDAGSVDAFARLMNAKAFSLGAANSHFINPNGLPRPGQFSTARDMARIAFAAYHNPTLRQFIRLPGLIFTYNSGRRRFLEPTNKLVMRSTIFNGMKTGYTDASGRCLISSASSGGREIILVQLGGTHHTLWDDAQRLLLWGLDSRSTSPVFATNDPN
jgi:serine-type D-Ala-D-Ala carboxypeptidase (penicillin-binding protein 5/6)